MLGPIADIDIYSFFACNFYEFLVYKYCEFSAVFLFLKESPEFHKRFFESAVSSIRIIAANHLWQVVPLSHLQNFDTLVTLSFNSC